MAGNSDNIVWNHNKIKTYFTNCYTEVYKPFLDNANDFITALMNYVNDEDHSGPEAESSKTFVHDWQVKLVIDTSYMINSLMGLMSGEFGGTVETNPILDHFLEEMQEEETAVVKTVQLNKVITDFARFNRMYSCVTRAVYPVPGDVEKCVAGVSCVTRKNYTHPDGENTNRLMNEFVSDDGETGFVPEFLQKFENFNSTHADDISGSDFKKMYDIVLNNIQQIVNGLGDGSFDITRFDETRDKVDWKTPKDVLSEEELKDYAYYMSFLAGSHGCNVQAYDPVNVNNGNYVCDTVDMLVGGPHRIELRRFYNAMLGKTGILGKGNTTPFDGHLTIADDKIKVLYRDGREGHYKKELVNGKEVYLEIHGDVGTLEKIDTGFRLTDGVGIYTEYDLDGYIVAVGDNNGVHTHISYDVLRTSTDGKIVEKAVPSKIETKEKICLNLSYNDAGYLIKAEDHTGRVVSYEYEVRGDEYLLSAVVLPDGNTKKYSYNDQGIIYKVTGRNGNVTLINKYDSKGRILHQTMADGSEISYSYEEEHITKVTEQNGNKVEYVTDDLGRNIKTRYPELGVEERFSYNDNNDKTSHTDRRGFTTRYNYDNRGHLTGIIGPEGLHEFFTYNSDGQISSKKDSLGNVTKFKYDLEGNLCTVIDALGNKTKYYYADGKVNKIKDAEGGITLLTYDEYGNIESITKENGTTTHYTNDALGRVLSSSDDLGNTTSYTYDVNDNITKAVDPEGNVTSYEYSNTGKVLSITNPDGTSRSWKFNSLDKAESFTDEENRTTKYLYNNIAKPEKVILPNNGEITYSYDMLGNLISESDCEGRKTVYSYDANGNRTETSKESKDGSKSIVLSRHEYDARNRVVASFDGDGNKTEFEYDANGNLICIIDALGGETHRYYDALNRVTKIVDQLGRESSFTYDLKGRIKTSTNAIGVVTENHYENGQLTFVSASDGESTHITKRYTYEACGRISRLQEEDGFFKEYTYDKNGRFAVIKDSNGKKLTFEYDSMGRVISKNDCGSVTRYTYTGTGKTKTVVDATGNKTEHFYNEMDQLIKTVRYGLNGEDDHVTSYSYDLSGRITETRNALGFKDHYEYDEFGMLSVHTDKDGNATKYQFSNNGHIRGIEYADGKSVRFKFNALNVLDEVKDMLGVTKYISDANGRVVEVVDHNGDAVKYEYADNDARTAVVYPDGKRAEYTYDSFGRLVSLTGFEGDDTKYSYDEYGRLVKKTLPNGVENDYTYYTGGFIKSLTTSDKDGVLDEYRYVYGANGKRVEIERFRRDLSNVSGTYKYDYDAEGRLVGVNKDGESIKQFTYDAYGNRASMTEGDTTVSYSYDALDRLNKAVSDITKEYSYDRRGNLVSVSVDGIEGQSYEFDSRNILVSAHDAEKGDVSYEYNWQKKRVGRKTESENISYFLDATRDYYDLLQRNVNGVVESFTYDTTAVEMNKDNQNYYYLQDELGSTTYMTGTDGYAIDSYAYDEFGNGIDPFTGKIDMTKRKNGYTKSGNIIQPFAFTGYQEDDVTGNYFAQARYYNAESGRFISEDIVRGFVKDPDTINHYLYCLNDPTLLVDRNGQSSSSSSSGSSGDYADSDVAEWVHDYNAHKYEETNVTPGCLNGTTDFSHENGTGQYVGAVYLLASDGADPGELAHVGPSYSAGHAAIALVKDDGTYEVYSIGGAPSGEGIVVTGYLGTYVDGEGNISSANYEGLVQNGLTEHDTIEHPNVNSFEGFTNFIYIPITNEEGEKMHEKAKALREDDYIKNKTHYNVLNNNCDQNVQMILDAGGKAFAPQGFHWLDWTGTQPNAVYEDFVYQIDLWNKMEQGAKALGIDFDNPYEGYYYGRLYDNNDLYDAYVCGG